MRWLAAFALVGCVQPAPQLLCGDTVFPASQVCSDGSAEGAACTINDVPGRCDACGNQLVCVPAACGDGVIDSELHEQCDGASSVATTGTQCADVGYDLGLLGCTASCAFDATACTRFGWQHYIDARVVSFWADGAVTAYAKTCDHCTSDDIPELHVTGGDFNLVVPGTFSLVTGGELGTGLRIVTAGLANDVRDIFVVQPDGLHPTSYPAHGDVASIAVGDDDEIYAITGCSGSSIPPIATLYVYDSQQWSSVSLRCDAVNPPKLAVGSSPSKRLFIANTSDGSTVAAGTVLEAGPPWSAPKLTPRLDPPQSLAIHDIAVRTTIGPEALYVVATTQANDGLLFRMPLDINTITPEGPLVADATLAFSNTAVFALSGIDGRTKRWDGDVFDDLRAPGGVIADDHHGALYVYTVGSPIYKFSGSTFGELDAPLLQHDLFPDDHVVAALDLKSATLVAAAHELFAYEPPSNAWLRTITTYSDPMRALAGSSSSSYVVSTYGDPTGSLGDRPTVHYHVATVDTDISPPTHPFIDGLWMDASGELYAAGFTLGANMPIAFFAHTKPSTTPGATTWTEIMMPETPGCSVNAVTGGTKIFAGGACNGIAQIWTLDASTLAMTTFPDITGAFYAIKSLPDGQIFAIGDAGAVWLDGNGTPHTYPDVAGRSISGGTDDIWVAGVNTPIQHFSGGVWSRMTTNPVGQMAISVSPTGNRVLMPGAASGFVSLLREP